MKRLFLLMIAAAVVAPIAAAQTQNQNTRYINSSFARISLITGNTFIQRAQDLGYEEGELNAPVSEGDRIGTTDGRVEISLGKRNYVRLDQNTKIDFAALPRRDSVLIRLRQWAGHLYLVAGTLEKEKSIEILTDDATFYILDKGLYRIDIRESGETEILVFQGLVEAAGADGSMLVKNAQRISLSDGRFQGRPSSFFAAAAEDSFDRFNSGRNSIVQRSNSRGYLSDDLSEYASELDENGDWVDMPEYGNVWVPRGLGSDWRPYSSGRWMWLPMAGWCWVPYESWGWAPFHYGRWQWGMGYGWYWIPMNVWGPAWVDWWWGPEYWGWAPLSYWGYPGILVNNAYYGRGWQGDYPYNSRALTAIRKDQLQAKNIQKVALSADALRGASKINMTNQMPNVRPTPHARISVEPMDGGRVILRNGGEGTAVGTTPGTSGRQISREGESNTTTRKGGETGNAGSTAGTIKSGDTQGNAGGRVIDAKKGEESKRTPPPANTGERKIRKKEGDPAGSGSGEMRSYAPNRELGYPSSASITRATASSGRNSSASIPDNIFRRVTGNSSSNNTSRSGSSVSRGSSGSSGSSSRGTVSRGSSSSSGSSSSGRSSSGSSSSRSGGSSSGSSRGSSGGSVRKK
jgi:hypothetical protein